MEQRDYWADHTPVHLAVQPPRYAGRTAEYHLTLRNSKDWPVVVLVVAHDEQHNLDCRITPEDHIRVPARGEATARLSVALHDPTLNAANHPYWIVCDVMPAVATGITARYATQKLYFECVPRSIFLNRLQRMRRRGWPVASLIAATFVLVLGAAVLRGTTGHLAPAMPLHQHSPSLPLVTRRGVPAATLSIPSHAAILFNPRVLDFGRAVGVGGARQDIHVVDLAPTAIERLRIAIEGTSARDFTAWSTCANVTLAPYMGCTIRVRFTPAMAGPRRASLVLLGQDAQQFGIVSLTGSADTRAPMGHRRARLERRGHF